MTILVLRISLNSLKFRQASNCCKSVFEAAKLAYATKIKESITSKSLGSLDFWRNGYHVFNKSKSVTPPLFNSWRCCPLHLIKQSCLLKTFLRTLILMTQVSLYLFSFLDLKLYNIPVTPKMVKRS